MRCGTRSRHSPDGDSPAPPEVAPRSARRLPVSPAAASPRRPRGSAFSAALETSPSWDGPSEACGFRLGAAVDAFALSADGSRLVVAGGPGGWLALLDSSRPLRAMDLLASSAPGKGHRRGVTALALLPGAGGDFFTAGRDGELMRWAADCGLLSGVTAHANGAVSAVLLNADPPPDAPSRLLLYTSGEDGRLRAWCAAARRSPPERLFSARASGGRITALALSPCGAHLASGASDNCVRLHDALTGVHGATLRAHGAWVTSLAFAPGQSATPLRLFSAAYDGEARLWDVPLAAAGGPLAAPAPPATPNADLMLSALLPLPGGAALATGSMGGAVRLWCLLGGGRMVGAACTGDAVTSLRHAPAPATAGAHCLLLSAHRSGSLRAFLAFPGGPTGLAPLWSVAAAHSDWANFAIPHPALGGGAVIISAGEDGWVRAWRAAPTGLAWSRAAHPAFPDGFRAAMRTLLLCLHRLGATTGGRRGAPRRRRAAPRLFGATRDGLVDRIAQHLAGLCYDPGHIAAALR